MEATKAQKKAFKKITKSKYPDKVNHDFGMYLPKYVDFANDYVAFIEFTKKVN